MAEVGGDVFKNGFPNFHGAALMLALALGCKEQLSESGAVNKAQARPFFPTCQDCGRSEPLGHVFLFIPVYDVVLKIGDPQQRLAHFYTSLYLNTYGQ